MAKIIVANWKMNPPSVKEADKLFRETKKKIRRSNKVEVLICPPFLYLSRFSGLKLGAQDVFWKEEGAFTGEVSPSMLESLGVEYVIIGHSERRRIFGETGEMISKKLNETLKSNLLPILCVGETSEERKKDLTFKVLEEQIRESVAGAPKSKAGKLIFSYEPIWAIGSGRPCHPDEAVKVALFIRKVVSKIFSSKASKEVKVLYGGSSNPSNARGYLKEPEISGLLVGGASLEAESFGKMVEIAKKY